MGRTNPAGKKNSSGRSPLTDERIALQAAIDLLCSGRLFSDRPNSISTPTSLRANGLGQSDRRKV
ncbi:hypothetical protein TNCV_336551, partial [Trichonephila clavipes]